MFRENFRENYVVVRKIIDLRSLWILELHFPKQVNGFNSGINISVSSRSSSLRFDVGLYKLLCPR